MTLLIRCSVSFVFPLALAVLQLWAGNTQSAVAALIGGVIGIAIGEMSWDYWRQRGHHPT